MSEYSLQWETSERSWVFMRSREWVRWHSVDGPFVMDFRRSANGNDQFWNYFFVFYRVSTSAPCTWTMLIQWLICYRLLYINCDHIFGHMINRIFIFPILHSQCIERGIGIGIVRSRHSRCHRNSSHRHIRTTEFGSGRSNESIDIRQSRQWWRRRRCNWTWQQ